MRISGMVKSIIFCGISILMSNCNMQHIDPYDMNKYNDDHNLQDQYANNVMKKPCECSKTKKYEELLYKRTINLILNSVGNRETEGVSIFKGIIYVNLSMEEYNILREFSTDKNNDIKKLYEIDEILSKMLMKPLYFNVIENVYSWSDKIYSLIYNRSTAILFFVCVILLVIYKLLKSDFTSWYILLYLFFILYVIDFMFTWIDLLQQEEIKHVADSIKYSSSQNSCDRTSRSWWQTISSVLLSEDECSQYHKAIIYDYFYKITPFTILLNQFNKVVKVTASTIGEGFGLITQGIIGSLPFGLNVVILPIVFIFMFTIIFIILLVFTRTKFKFSTLLLGIEIGDKSLKDYINPLSKMHRTMIEDVKTVVDKSTGSNKNENDENSQTDEKTISNLNETMKPNDGSGDAKGTNL